MARTTSQPATATRRNTRTTQPDTNRLSPLDKQDQESRTDGNDERGFGDNQNRERESASRNERDEYNEEGTRGEQRPATLAASMDTFTPVLEAWKQVFKSWSELTETMVKVQQDAFASMVSGANAHAKELNLGENRNGERALSGAPTASTPERIDRDRR
jgi:hypothetical protein